MTARLLRAYRDTAYEAEGAIARIGRRGPGVDALLRRLGGRHGAFVTACNPLSRRMPAGWNRRAMQRLREQARRLRHAEGHGIGRGWREHHLLLAAHPRRAAMLARRFRQRAIVVLARGCPARLVWLHAQGELGERTPPPNLALVTGALSTKRRLMAPPALTSGRHRRCNSPPAKGRPRASRPEQRSREGRRRDRGGGAAAAG